MLINLGLAYDGTAWALGLKRHTQPISAAHNTSRSDEEEREASRFASELLAPAEALAREVPAAPTLNDLVDVKLKVEWWWARR